MVGLCPGEGLCGCGGLPECTVHVPHQSFQVVLAGLGLLVGVVGCVGQFVDLFGQDVDALFGQGGMLVGAPRDTPAEQLSRIF